MYFRVLETQKSQVPQRHNSTIGKRSFRYNKGRSTGGLADPSGVLDPGQRMGGGTSNWGGGRFVIVPWGVGTTWVGRWVCPRSVTTSPRQTTSQTRRTLSGGPHTASSGWLLFPGLNPGPSLGTRTWARRGRKAALFASSKTSSFLFLGSIVIF